MMMSGRAPLPFLPPMHAYDVVVHMIHAYTTKTTRTVGVHRGDGGEGEGDELGLLGPELLQFAGDAGLGQRPMV